VVASYLFDGYGVRKVASSDPTAPQDPYSGYGGLAGYYTDWETGLCLLGYRYYDVLAGRFLTRDPIGFEGGINLYEYVHNSPLTLHDASGTVASAVPVPGSSGFPTGPVAGGFIGCSLSAVTNIIKHLEDDRSCPYFPPYLFCTTLFACIGGGLCRAAICLMIEVEVCALPDISCLIGIACNLLSTLLTQIYCHDPCTMSHETPPSPCQLLTNALANCLGGGICPIPGGFWQPVCRWGIGTVLGGLGNQLCKVLGLS
jgi:RHS repeat-associated protein